MTRPLVRFDVTPTTLRATLSNLKKLPNGTRRKSVRIAMNAGMGVFKRAAERFVPRETGLLKKSLGVKVKIPTNKNKPAYGIVGPRRGFKRAVGRLRRGSSLRTVGKKTVINMLLGGETVVYRNPSRYAHLAERHKPYLGRAQRAVARAAIDTMSRRLGREVELEAAKLANPPPKAAA
jgi:hypothetical protein